MTLLGREPERKLIAALLHTCREGGRRGLVLTGPLGIGKSALLRDAAVTARALGLPTAIVRASDLSDLSAADVIGEILRQLKELPDALARSSRDALLFHHLDRSQSPVVIEVEDIELLSFETAAEFFDGLRRTTRPMAILGSLSSGTSRSAPPSSGDLWYDFIDLRPLDSEFVGVLASTYLNGPVVPSVASKLAQASGGNPLFALELLRSWRLSDTLTSVAGYWCWNDGEPPETIPESIADTVAVRIERLNQAERDMLLALVVLGRTAALDELRVFTRDTLTAQTVSRLSDLGFILESQGSQLAYSVAQPAYIAAVRRRTSATAIAAMHGRIYEGLQQLSGSTSAELAHHGCLALVEPADLAETVSAAAEEARAAHKHPLAARWYEYLATKAQRSDDRVPLLLKQADSETTFDPTRAIATFTLAVEAASSSDARAEALAGRARANRRLGRHDRMRQDLDDAKLLVRNRQLEFEIDHALAVHAGIERRFTEAEARLCALRVDELNHEQMAKVEGHLAQVAYASGNVHAAAARAEEALSLTHETEQQAFLGSNLGWYLVILGEWRRAAELLEDRGSVAEASGDLWTLANIRCDQARLHAWRGFVPRGLELASAALRLARLLDSTVDRVHSLEALGTSLLEAGDTSAAVDAFVRSLDLLEADVEPRDLALNHTQLASAYLLSGELALASRTLDRCREYLVDAPIFEILVDRAQGELLYRLGQSFQALEICERWVSEPSAFKFGQAWLLETFARVLDLTGKRRAAVAQANEAVEIYSLLGAETRRAKASAWIDRIKPKRLGRPPSSLPYGLTKREIEVLWMTTQGKTAREAATALFLSEGTVRKHLENIKSKAGVSRKAELVTFASRLGIRPDSVPEYLAEQRPDAGDASP